MPETAVKTEARTRPQIAAENLLHRLKNRSERIDRVRRGVCLVNAGKYEQAEATFRDVMADGEEDHSVSSYLAASLLGKGAPEAAADQFDRIVAEDSAQTTARIRHALALWSAQKCNEAIESLRSGIRENPECAELHFQLGTLLAAREHYEEAELRFTQVLNINPDHTSALVSYALCCAVRNAPNEALTYLRRAQARKPEDARIGLLLSQTAKALRQQGLAVRIRAQMPDTETANDQREIEELSRVIEGDPEFVDAFLTLPADRIDQRVFSLLLMTLQTALSRRPEHSELHYHCGRVLERLGRFDDAIEANERAVAIDPTFARALIELGKLYQKTDRMTDAKTRLERAIAAGAEYPDVYYLLGNVYQKQGLVSRARSAYRRALILNERYEAALTALKALPA